MKTNRQLFKGILLCGMALLTLSACGQFTPESSKDVIHKFKAALKDVKAADFSVDATMVGADKSDNMNLAIKAGAKFDHRDGVDRKADLKLGLSGSLVADGKNLNGSLDAEVRSLGDNFFFNIAKLDSNDPSMDKYKEIIKGYQGKWLQLASDFVPESLKQFQQKDAKTLETEGKLMDLFIDSNLFEVNKEFGVESLNGNKVYHYGVKIDEGGLRDYVQKSAAIQGREMSDAEVDQSVAFVKSVSNIELWIGAKDYDLYKGVVALQGQGTDGPQTNLNLNFIGNSYNVDPMIQAPENPEQFNPITLMMQLQLLNPPASQGASTEASPASSSEVKTDVNPLTKTETSTSAKASVSKKAVIPAPKK
jgi:hypothetical protein